ncbi:hypothetical protein [Helicobacter sp. T3_23-1056]
MLIIATQVLRLARNDGKPTPLIPLRKGGGTSVIVKICIFVDCHAYNTPTKCGFEK